MRKILITITVIALMASILGTGLLVYFQTIGNPDTISETISGE